MKPFSLREAAAAVGSAPPAVEAEVRGICTDTREGTAGSLFFALRGENSDGHAYVAQAFEGGAVGAVVERWVDGIDGPLLVAKDALSAFGKLAEWYRMQFDIPVLGVTGSVGKTSTKEMLALILGARYRVTASEKNFNNEIGVPKTLFKLDETSTAAVIEMAMRGAGQIAWLAEIARPNVGVITNIGLSHIELLGSREGIAEAKAELLSALPEDGLAVIPADDDFCEVLRNTINGSAVTFGLSDAADFQVTDVESREAGESSFRINGRRFTIHAPGVHHPVNAAAACAASSYVGIGLEEAADRLAQFRTSDMRMETIRLPNGTTILSDCYNAAPDSMRSALETLAHLGTGRKVAVLGEMRELGDRSDEAHAYVGELVSRARPSVLATVGERAFIIAESARENGFTGEIATFNTTADAASDIHEVLLEGDVVLVKGSRAMEMERIVSSIAIAAGGDKPGAAN